MGQLGVEQADDLAPRTEHAGVVFDAGVARQFGNQVSGNEIAKLAKIGELAGGWHVAGFLFMPYLVARSKPASQPFLSLNLQPDGTVMSPFHWLPC